VLSLVACLLLALPPAVGGQESPADGAPVEGAPAPSEVPPPEAPPSIPAPPGTPIIAPTEGAEPLVAPVPLPPGTVPSLRLPVVVPGALVPTATLSLRPTLGLAEEYSDNFNLSPTDRVSNFRTTVTPGATLLINGARATGSVGYSLSVNHDSSTGQFTYFNNLLGQVTYTASPLWTLTVYDTLTQSDDRRLADSLELRTERQTFVSNVFSISSDYLISTVATRLYYRLSTFFGEDTDTTVTHGFGASVSTALQLYTTSLGYEYLLSSSTDGDTIDGHQIYAAVSRPFGTQLSGGISGSYAFRTQTGEDVVDENFSIWNVSAFGSYTGPRLGLSVSLGYGQAVSDVKGSQPAPTASATLTYRFARAIFTLGADSGFSETFDLGENFGVVKTYGGTATLFYPITPLVATSATAFYRRNQPTGLGGGIEVDANRNWGGGVSLSVPLRRWLNFTLGYSYINWMSDSGEDDYTENRVRAALNAQF
jgi:hypothetical protein